MRPAAIPLLALFAACEPTPGPLEGLDPVPPCERTFFADGDGDGFGDPEAPAVACEERAGLVSDATDCDDADPLVFPGGEERCDGVDEDCDGVVDDNAIDALEWYFDEDGDGFGASWILACAPIDGTIALGGDCDDADPTVFPGAEPEVFDGFDRDCDGAPEIPDPEGVTVTAFDYETYPPLDEVQRAPRGPVVVRAIGVYQGHDDGPIEVVVRTTQPTILVLANYRPVSWTVTETWPGTIVEVIATGAREGSVVAPEGVPVWNPAWVDDFYSLSDPKRYDMAAVLESDFGLSIDSYHAIYEASRLVMDPVATVLPDPDWPECDGYVPTPFSAPEPDRTAPTAECPDQTSESAWCLGTYGDGQLVVLGLDSLSTCKLAARFEFPYGAPVGGLAWIGGDVYGCMGEDQILERVPLDGSALPDRAPIWCGAAIADRGELLVVPISPDPYGSDAFGYASWGDAQCGEVASERQVGWTGSLYAAADGVGYAAWPFTSTIEKHDLSGGTGLIGSVPLEYEGWIRGLAAAGDRLVITTWEPEDGDPYHHRARVFDTTSGALLASARVDHALNGLTCVEN